MILIPDGYPIFVYDIFLSDKGYKFAKIKLKMACMGVLTKSAVNK